MPLNKESKIFLSLSFYFFSQSRTYIFITYFDNHFLLFPILVRFFVEKGYFNILTYFKFEYILDEFLFFRSKVNLWFYIMSIESFIYKYISFQLVTQTK